MRLTDISTIQLLCKKHGFSLSKQFGQNFLTNPGICPKLCDVAQLTKEHFVLEIGPGFGTLTQELSQRANKVVALEVDARLLPVLDETLAGYDNVEIIHKDAMKADLAAIFAEKCAGPAMVCANLPYNITSPIIMRLLEEGLPISALTVMVQKEAAERLCATPGTRAGGAITYAVHYYATPELHFTVAPGSFTPPPKVQSAVITLTLHEKRALENHPEREKRLFSLIRAAFSQRRKTLANSLSAGTNFSKEQILTTLEQLDLLPTVRAEQLTLENYIDMQTILWP